VAGVHGWGIWSRSTRAHGEASRQSCRVARRREISTETCSSSARPSSYQVPVHVFLARRRRSCSLLPPHTPCFCLVSSAKPRHCRRTGQPASGAVMYATSRGTGPRGSSARSLGPGDARADDRPDDHDGHREGAPMAMAAAPGSPTTVPPRGPLSIRTGTDTRVSAWPPSPAWQRRTRCCRSPPRSV
jgi:hypothetical protein